MPRYEREKSPRVREVLAAGCFPSSRAPRHWLLEQQRVREKRRLHAEWRVASRLLPWIHSVDFHHRPRPARSRSHRRRPRLPHRSADDRRLSAGRRRAPCDRRPLPARRRLVGRRNHRRERRHLSASRPAVRAVERSVPRRRHACALLPDAARSREDELDSRRLKARLRERRAV